jgi:Flp pilus assembly protein TadG
VRPALKSRQAGATAVEFALVFLLFLTFLLAIIDFSRMLYTWNAASEATREGARYATVCDTKANKVNVLARMKTMLPQLTIDNLTLVWEDDEGNSCTLDTCAGVTVTIENLDYQWISPIAGLARGIGIAPLRMPSFKTYLTREMMGQDPNSYLGANLCSL